MLVKDLLSHLKKVKDFAQETASHDMTKNVKIAGDETHVVFQCCDGNSGIRHVISQDEEQSILGEFCVNVFKLYNLINKQDKSIDLKMRVDLHENLKITGKGVRLSLKAMPPTQILQIPRHTTWSPLLPGLIEGIEVIAKLVEGEAFPVVYDGTRVYSAHKNIAAYKEVGDFGVTEFRVESKLAPRLCIDTFSEIDVTENHIYCKNDGCEIFVGRTGLAAPTIAPIVKMVNNAQQTIIPVTKHSLKIAYETIKTIKNEWHQSLGNPNAVKFVFGREASKLTYADSEFDLSIQFVIESDIELYVPMGHLDAILEMCDAEFIEIVVPEGTNVFSARMNGVTFFGGLAKV